MQTYEFLFEPGLTLKQKILIVERRFISDELMRSAGRVTPAARALGFPGHQSLVAIIKTRHPELISERSAVCPRRKPLMHLRREPRATRMPRDPNRRTSVLLVSDGQHVAPLVQWPTSWSAVAVGKSALDLITGESAFDVLVLCDTAEMAAEDLATRARRIQHRRKTPQLLLARDAAQADRAWKAGADAVLLVPEERDQIVTIVARLLKGRR